MAVILVAHAVVMLMQARYQHLESCVIWPSGTVMQPNVIYQPLWEYKIIKASVGQMLSQQMLSYVRHDHAVTGSKQDVKKDASRLNKQKQKARRKQNQAKKFPYTSHNRTISLTQHNHANVIKTRQQIKVIIMDEYLLCNALNRDISPPSSLPTALICLLMAWQISLPAAICAFSPSKPPRVARNMKETQRREYTASTCVCVARG